MIEPLDSSQQTKLTTLERQLGQRRAAATVGLARSTFLKAARGDGVYPSTRIIVRDYLSRAQAA